MTTQQNATSRAIFSGRARYGQPGSHFNTRELDIDLAPETYVTAQGAAGADDIAAARVATNPDATAANLLAARCFADVDNAFRVGVAGGSWLKPKTQKATISMP